MFKNLLLLSISMVQVVVASDDHPITATASGARSGGGAAAAAAALSGAKRPRGDIRHYYPQTSKTSEGTSAAAAERFIHDTLLGNNSAPDVINHLKCLNFETRCAIFKEALMKECKDCEDGEIIRLASSKAIIFKDELRELCIPLADDTMHPAMKAHFMNQFYFSRTRTMPAEELAAIKGGTYISLEDALDAEEVAHGGAGAEETPPRFVLTTETELFGFDSDALEKTVAYFRNHPDDTLILMGETKCFSVDFNNSIPFSLKKLILVGEGVEHLEGDELISDDRPERSLESVDLTGLSNVVTIGSGLFRDCDLLKSVDLAPLHNVRKIDSAFFRLAGLESIDLSPLHNVTDVIDGFLTDCHLNSIDLSPLSKLEELHEYFLAGNNFESINLSPLRNVKTISSGFLQDCSRLESVDLSPFSNVREISYGFFADCISLRTIDFSPLRSLVSFYNGVDGLDIKNFEGCDSLESITFGDLSDEIKTMIIENIDPDVRARVGL